ncbi:hypothetical protein [Methanopyrus sp. KOL6]|uniref:hypothetical protein n=1 Tax=Methanopyrus sp. KOL6 TaxID=1937004 RepID=UPI0012F9588B|nr:hypothetical protein [Methanopyrus sp. KOL6]
MLRVSPSEGARRVWRAIKTELSEHGPELGKLEEELSAAVPEDAEIKEIRAYGYRRSVGIFRRIDRLWILIRGDGSVAKDIERNLIDRIVKDIEDPKIRHKLNWALRGALRVTTIDDVRPEHEVIRRITKLCVLCGSASVTLLGIEALAYPERVVKLLPPAIAVSGAAGCLLPWRVGLLGLADDALDRPKRVSVPVAVSLALLVLAGLVSSLLLPYLGIGFLGVVIAACVMGFVAARFVEMINREIVKVE